MSQEFVYAAIARPTLRPSDLVYRRRVAKPSAADPKKGALSKEEKYRLEDSADDLHYESTASETLYEEADVSVNTQSEHTDSKVCHIDDTV